MALSVSFKASGLQFLADFVGDKARAERFARVFVPPVPLLWDHLLAKIQVGTTRRILVVDGQGRVGKTWSVAAAIAVAVDNGLDLDDVWTSGEDSRQLTPSNLEPLDEVLAELEKALRCRPSPPRLILLDDVLGTMTLRPVLDRELAMRWFSFDSEGNRLLSSLHPDGGLAIITNRSSILTAFDTETNLGIRRNPKVTRIAFGIFERRGGVLGAYDEARLLKMASNYGVPEDSDWYPSPHMLSLRRLVLSGQWTEEEYKANASKDLFLADITELYRASALGSPAEDTLALQRARKAFALTIAPGLLFMGKPTFRLLRLDEDTLTDLIKELHLRPEDDATQWVGSSVIPNRFFGEALKMFFKTPGRVSKLCATMDSWLPNLGSEEKAIAVRGLVVRGLVEQALIQREEPDESDEETASILGSAVDSFPAGDAQNFLRWEMSGMATDIQHAVNWPALPSFKTGFVAALGWSLWRFISLRSQCVGVIVHFCETGRHAMATGRMEIVPGAYSPLLQWVLWCAAHEQASGQNQGPAQESLELLKQMGAETVALKIILFDEALWAAFTDEATDRGAETTCALNRIGRLMLEDMQWPDVHSDKRVLANVHFSLCWHNAWLNSSERSVWANTWLTDDSDRLIVQHPEYLRENLEYHWQHFVTQTGVWMREWCLGDPFEEERRRTSQRETGLHGGTEQRTDQHFASLIIAVFSNAPSQMVRNALLLAGIRVFYSKNEIQWTELCDALTKRLDTPNDFRHADDCTAVMEAIYELAREDVIFRQEPTAKPARLIEDAARGEWIPRCHQMATGAWTKYRNGLLEATCLDLLPEDVEDISPELAQILNEKR